MIYWFFGNSGAGKTTAAQRMKDERDIFLDGDEMRNTISKDLGFSENDRCEANARVMRLAKLLDEQTSDDTDIIVAMITPYRALRAYIKKEIGEENMVFMYMDGGREASAEYPFEEPDRNFF